MKCVFTGDVRRSHVVVDEATGALVEETPDVTIEPSTPELGGRSSSFAD